MLGTALMRERTLRSDHCDVFRLRWERRQSEESVPPKVTEETAGVSVFIDKKITKVLDGKQYINTD